MVNRVTSQLPAYSFMQSVQSEFSSAPVPPTSSSSLTRCFCSHAYKMFTAYLLKSKFQISLCTLNGVKSCVMRISASTSAIASMISSRSSRLKSFIFGRRATCEYSRTIMPKAYFLMSGTFILSDASRIWSTFCT